MTHGGFGYAEEYHVERLFREVSITLLAPITEQLILSFIAEKVLELPKNYSGIRDCVNQLTEHFRGSAVNPYDARFGVKAAISHPRI